LGGGGEKRGEKGASQFFEIRVGFPFSRIRAKGGDKMRAHRGRASANAEEIKSKSPYREKAMRWEGAGRNSESRLTPWLLFCWRSEKIHFLGGY